MAAYNKGIAFSADTDKEEVSRASEYVYFYFNNCYYFPYSASDFSVLFYEIY